MEKQQPKPAQAQKTRGISPVKLSVILLGFVIAMTVLLSVNNTDKKVNVSSKAETKKAEIIQNFFPKKSAVGLLPSYNLASVNAHKLEGNEKAEKKKQVLKALSKAPVIFTENKGQWQDDIAFRSSIFGMHVSYMKTGLSYCFDKTGKKEPEQMVWNEYFEGMNKNANIIGGGDEMKSMHPTTYIIGMGGGNNKTITDIPSYPELSYVNVYNNIDVKYHTNNSSTSQMETDYILRSGADVKDIRVRFDGIKGLSVDKKGVLLVKNAWGVLREYIPASYQLVNGQKKDISVKYKLIDDYSYGFEICGIYDRSKELIIDPIVLDWGTFTGPLNIAPGQPGFVGDEHQAQLYDLEVDDLGFTYAACWAQMNFPTTPGVYQPGIAGQCDALVYKLNVKATAMVWATYIGTTNGGSAASTQGDAAWGIDIDNKAGNGNVFVTGYTDRNTFPTTAGSFQPTFAGSSSAFALKLNPTGTALVYSTFLGSNSGGQSIEVLPSGNAVVGGWTGAGFPTAGGPAQAALGGGIDGFLAILNPAGSGLVYGSYVGGTKNDTVFRIAVDAAGANIYASGTTNSTNFPTKSPYQAALAGLDDAFVFKATSAGAMVYASYFGGTGNDEGYGIDVNTNGEAYLCGTTGSANLPLAAAFQGAIKGKSDAFLTKFNAAGSGLIYSTYLGGTQLDWGYDVDVDCKDEAFANGTSQIINGGQTTSANFPLTPPCGFTETISTGVGASPPGGNNFIAKFNPTGSLIYSALKWAATTWQPRTAIDLVERNCCVIAMISAGTVGHIVNGYDFITTPGVFQEIDPRWTKFSTPYVYRLTPKPNLSLDVTMNPKCASTPTLIATIKETCWGTPSMSWDLGDGTTGTSDTIIHTYKAAGNYNITVIASCPPDTLKKTITITSAAPCGPTVTAIGNSVCVGGCANISATPTGGTVPYTFTWSSGATAQTANVCPTVPTTYTVTLTDNTGVTSTSTAAVGIYPVTTLNTVKTDVKCIGQTNGTATATGTSGTSPYSYTWSTAPTQTTAIATGLGTGTYTVTSSDAHGCTATATATIGQPTPIVLNTNTVPALCGSTNGSATVSGTGGTGAYTYSWMPGAVVTSTISNIGNGTYSVTVTDNNGCTVTTTAVVNSIGGATVAVKGFTNILCQGGNNGDASVTISGGTKPYNILWSPTGGIDSVATGLKAGTYTVVVKDANNCQQSTTVVLTEPPLLTLTAAAVSPVCPGGGTVSSTPGGGTPGYLYSWMPSGASTQTVTGVSGGIYTVTLTDANGCTTTATTNITSPPAIVLGVTPVDGKCGLSNGSASVSSTGGTPGYVYNWAPAGGNGITAIGLSANDYTVTVTDSKGCTQTITTTVGNSPPLALAASTITNVSCKGGNDGSAGTTVGGGTAPITYAWTPTGGAGPTATTLIAGIYSVSVSDAKGCTAISTTTITEPPPVAVAIPVVPTICIGQSTTLTANAGGGTPNYTYGWLAGGETTPSITVSPVVTTGYTVGLVDSKGCTSSSTVIVSVNPPLTVNAIAGKTVCAGSSTIISATAGGGNGGSYTYNWLPSGTGPSLTVTPVGTQTYTVTVNDDCGTPVATSVVTIQSVNPILTPTFTPDSTLGCAPLSVTFTNTTTGGVIKSCLWDLGDGNTSTNCAPTYTYRKSGIYSVKLTVTDTNGCSTTLTKTSTVKVWPLPIASFLVSPKSTSILEPTISFTDQSSPDVVKWNWSFGDVYNSGSTKRNPSYTYKDTGTYDIQLIVTNQYGCIDTITDVVIIHGDYAFYVPNAFSPNGDGKNETFFPKGFMIYPPCFHMMIFDRWGNLIWETRDLNLGWDGKANGGAELAQQDVYVWKIETCDYRKKLYKYIGHVTLVK
jgi:gliding motility-associated-like protein